MNINDFLWRCITSLAFCIIKLIISLLLKSWPWVRCALTTADPSTILWASERKFTRNILSFVFLSGLGLLGLYLPHFQDGYLFEEGGSTTCGGILTQSRQTLRWETQFLILNQRLRAGSVNSEYDYTFSELSVCIKSHFQSSFDTMIDRSSSDWTEEIFLLF